MTGGLVNLVMHDFAGELFEQLRRHTRSLFLK